MTSASEIAAQLLAFTVAEFGLFQDVDLADRTRNLLYSDFLGVVISAPIDEPSGAGFSQGAAYPIAVGYRMPGARLWDAPIARNAVLVARNLVDGRVLLRDPFKVPGGHKRHSERAPLERGERPPASQFPKATADIAWVDGAARGLTSLPGEWHLTLIWYDWASNEVTYRVQGEPDPPSPRPVFLPVVLNPDRKPALPEARKIPGITLAAARAKDTIRVAGRLAVRNRAHMTPELSQSEPAPDAVVPVTLLVMGPNTPHQAHRYFVPAVVTDTTAQSEFIVDLGLEGPPLPPGPLVIWAIADDVLVGPVYVDDAP